MAIRHRLAPQSSFSTFEIAAFFSALCSVSGCGGVTGEAMPALQDAASSYDATSEAGICFPRTCASEGHACGDAPDGCGGVIDCGACPKDTICGGGGPNKCGTAKCEPATCTAVGANCGFPSDLCGSTLSCGGCTAPQTCGGAGVLFMCGCTPTTCAGSGAQCGAPPDNCGGSLSCGSCTAPQICGGAGVQYMCGCTPATCASLNVKCGTVDDGCGTMIQCTDCCTPQCVSHHACGDDSCGGSCGSCSGGRSCHGAYCTFELENEVGASCNTKCKDKLATCVGTSIGSCASDKVDGVKCYCW